MVKHIVVWKMADIEDKSERMQVMKEKLEALKNDINLIQSIEVGINFNEKETDVDVVLVSEFLTREDMEAYLVHPLHKAAGKDYVKPYVTSRYVIDYEF